MEFNVPFQHKYGYIRDDEQNYKSKQKAQSEMYDYDFKTKIKCTTVTPLDKYRSSHEVISQTIDKILSKVKD